MTGVESEIKNFDAAMDRLYWVANVGSDSDLAKFLGISRQSVSSARNKKKIPKTWLVTVREKKQINPTWLKTGEGDTYLPGYDGVRMVLTAPTDEERQREQEIMQGLGEDEDERLHGPRIPRDGSTTVTMLGAVNSRLNLPPEKAPTGIVYGSEYVKVRHVEGFVNIPFIEPWLGDEGQVVPADQMAAIAMRRSTVDKMVDNWRKLVWMRSAALDMAPTIQSGDELLLDLGQTRSISGAMYAIVVANNILIRTQTIGPKGPAFRATDPAAPPIPADSCHVLGRVLRICHSLI
jgi:hypothetical protein